METINAKEALPAQVSQVLGLIPASPPAVTFRAAVCHKLCCSDARYEESTFRRCLPWHVWLLAPVINWCRASVFDDDRALILAIGGTRNLREMDLEVEAYRSFRFENAFLRLQLGLRLSIPKLHDLAEALAFPE